MDPSLAVPVVLALVLGLAFVVNEWTDGALGASVGLGRHHMHEGSFLGTAHAHAAAAPCDAGGGPP